MTDQEIRHLLNRFMEGLTTLEEERQLGEFFAEWGKKPHPENDDWAVYQKMFAYFDQGMTGEPTASAPTSPATVRHLLPWRGIAAAILLVAVCGIGWLLLPKQPKQIAEAQDPVANKVLSSQTNHRIATTDGTAAHPVMRNLPSSKPSSAVASVVSKAPKKRHRQKSMQPSHEEELAIIAQELKEHELEEIKLKQEIRNCKVEAVYSMISNEDNRLHLVMDESGDYQIMAAPSPIEL